MAISRLKKKTIKAGIRLLIFFTIVSLVTSCYPPVYREVPSTNPNQSSNAPVTQVYFYPQNGQTTEQQSRDHYECYNWAVNQTGFDPSQSTIPPKERVKVVPMPPPGHDTVVMSIAGAVLGALIAGPRHAGGGALIGAASGAMLGATSDISREESARQIEEAYQNSDQARDVHNEKRALQFRRAMSACLEGRGYTVK